jgi:tRNA(Ile)-lysidine synthase TilS/MesJ
LIAFQGGGELAFLQDRVPIETAGEEERRMGSELNYPDWRADHRPILESLPGKTVMMLYSGGKDSSVVLHFMQQASNDFDFSFKTFAGLFPQHVFPPADRERLDRYWRRRGVGIDWHLVQETDDRLDAAVAEQVSPCLICNTAKKMTLIRYLKKEAVDMRSLVIVMSYSLWDLVSASTEHTLTSVYAHPDAMPTVRHKSTEERFLETSQRFYPFLQFNSGFAVFKPLIRYNDQDIVKLIADEGIPLLSSTCRFRDYRPKRLFSRYYESMGLRFDFEKVLAFARTAHHLPDESVFTRLGEDSYLRGAI